MTDDTRSAHHCPAKAAPTYAYKNMPFAGCWPDGMPAEFDEADRKDVELFYGMMAGLRQAK